MKRNGYRTFDQYRRLSGVNWSLLRAMADSPLHYRYRKLHEREDTPAMALGRAVHTAILEPDRFLVEFGYYDGPRRAGKEWEQFAAVNAGKTILKPDEYERVLDIRDAVRTHKVARRLLRWGQPELTLQWRDPETRMRLKARPDWLAPDGSLVDLKSTRSVEARTFGRLAVKMRYIEQLAFYRMGLRARGYPDGPAYLLAVEVDGPHDVGVFEVDDDMLWAGEQTVRELLGQARDYRNFKYPPGRYPGLVTLDVPPWFFEAADDEERILMGLKEKS